jgi:hypothetical protein
MELFTPFICIIVGKRSAGKTQLTKKIITNQCNVICMSSTIHERDVLGGYVGFNPSIIKNCENNCIVIDSLWGWWHLNKNISMNNEICNIFKYHKNSLIVTMGYLSLPPTYMDSVDYFIFFKETNIRDITQQYNTLFEPFMNILAYKDIHDKLDKYGYIFYNRKINNISVF